MFSSSSRSWRRLRSSPGARRLLRAPAGLPVGGFTGLGLVLPVTVRSAAGVGAGWRSRPTPPRLGVLRAVFRAAACGFRALAARAGFRAVRALARVALRPALRPELRFFVAGRRDLRRLAVFRAAAARLPAAAVRFLPLADFLAICTLRPEAPVTARPGLTTRP
jgi:hypothetical protein